MTIYTRTYELYGGIQSVLIVGTDGTGLLSGTLLDYSRAGKLVSIVPNTSVSAMELKLHWHLMEVAAAQPTNNGLFVTEPVQIG